jgi:hypothetical protein
MIENNGKKGIRLLKEDFVCDLKFESVTKKRLAETEDISVCSTMTCKGWK